MTHQGEDDRNLESRSAEEILDGVLEEAGNSRPCLTCSFQAEDIVLLHLVRQRLPAVPVLFLDTGYHFAETCAFRDELAREWDLHLVNLTAQQTVAQQESAFGILYRENPTRCCQWRKVEPLMAGLQPYDIWFTGLRREQSPTRKNLKKIEWHRLPGGKSLLKVNPLADWTWERVWEYTRAHGLSHLPQYDRGYTSIGCEPCTTLPTDPANPRSGRWGGQKLECGIHTFSEKAR